MEPVTLGGASIAAPFVTGAIALLWVVALGSYNATDPVWFFNTGGDGSPLNFAGPVGVFMAELGYQLLGYSAFLLPVILVVAGWHYFWCKKMDAASTKAIGATLMIACVASFLSLAACLLLRVCVVG